jgi:SAM-dependent methyltransferase
MADKKKKHDQNEIGSKPAFVYATTRDWPGYFAAIAGREPRDTLIKALDLYSKEPQTRTRFAIDLGCGEGRDTAELLREGWSVLAIDGHPDGIQRLIGRDDLVNPDQLLMKLGSFEKVELPQCDLLNASFSLPFCHPEHFDSLWARIVKSIQPDGRFSGQLFGKRDSWASIPDRSHQTREQVDELFSDFTIEFMKEEEREGQDCDGIKKHWHVFHVVAKRKS